MHGLDYAKYKIRNILAKCMSEVLHDVEIEPALTPLTGEQHFKATRRQEEEGQKAVFDVRVFNPFASACLSQKLENVFNSNKRAKKELTINES